MSRNSKFEDFTNMVRDQRFKNYRGDYAIPTQIFYNAIVVSNSDPEDGNIIFARIPKTDDLFSDESLPPCIPLMPNHLNVIPKIGEHVIVFFQDPWNLVGGRYYIGPVMTRDNFDNQKYNETFTDLGLIEKEDKS